MDDEHSSILRSKNSFLINNDPPHFLPLLQPHTSQTTQQKHSHYCRIPNGESSPADAAGGPGTKYLSQLLPTAKPVVRIPLAPVPPLPPPPPLNTFNSSIRQSQARRHHRRYSLLDVIHSILKSGNQKYRTDT